MQLADTVFALAITAVAALTGIYMLNQGLPDEQLRAEAVRARECADLHYIETVQARVNVRKTCVAANHLKDRIRLGDCTIAGGAGYLVATSVVREGGVTTPTTLLADACESSPGSVVELRAVANCEDSEWWLQYENVGGGGGVLRKPDHERTFDWRAPRIFSPAGDARISDFNVMHATVAEVSTQSQSGEGQVLGSDFYSRCDEIVHLQ